jgi:hypothetical protein
MKRIRKLFRYCCDMNVTSPYSSVEILTFREMVLEGGAVGGD